MIKVKIKKEIAEFIENSGEIASSGNDEFIHYPFWLKKTEDPEVFEVYKGWELPMWVKEELNFFGGIIESHQDE